MKYLHYLTPQEAKGGLMPKQERSLVWGSFMDRILSPKTVSDTEPVAETPKPDVEAPGDCDEDANADPAAV